MSKWLAVLGALSFAVTSCSGAGSGSGSGSEGAETTGTGHARIVGGKTDTGDPAVVELDVTTNKGGDCTASFIATTVLLTAAHCVLDDNGKVIPNAQYRFFTGQDENQAQDSDWTYIQPQNVHPNPAYDNNSSANDVAVLVLDHPFAVTPLPINTQPLAASLVGSAVRIVGYGSSVQGTPPAGQDGFGIKRELKTTLRKIESDVILVGDTGGQACDGDSGGPVLLVINGVETIIGTDDYSDATIDCTTGDYYQRVDQQMGFINQYLPPATDAGATDSGGPIGSGDAGEADSAAGDDASGASDAADHDSGGAADAGSTTNHDGASGGDPASSSGCSCDTAGRGNTNESTLLWVGAIAWLVALRKRRVSSSVRSIRV